MGCAGGTLLALMSRWGHLSENCCHHLPMHFLVDSPSYQKGRELLSAGIEVKVCPMATAVTDFPVDSSAQLGRISGRSTNRVDFSFRDF